MARVNLDDGCLSHPKVMAAGHDGWALWVAAIVYCGQHLTDGFLPASSLPALHPWGQRTRRQLDATVKVLVACGLLEVVEGGWQLHDWDDHQRYATKEAAEGRRGKWKGQKKRQREKECPPPCPPVDNENVHPPVRRLSTPLSTPLSAGCPPDPLPLPLPLPIPVTDPEHSLAGVRACAGQGVGEERESQEGTSGDAEGCASDEQAELLEALRSHPELRLVTTAKFAGRLLTHRLTGRTMAQLVEAIGQAAQKVGGRADVGHHMLAPAIADFVNGCCSRPPKAKPEPTPAPWRGVGMEPQQGVWKSGLSDEEYERQKREECLAAGRERTKDRLDAEQREKDRKAAYVAELAKRAEVVRTQIAARAAEEQSNDG